MTFSLLTSKVERVALLKSFAEKLFDLFANNAFTLPTYAPDFLQSVDVHGDVGTYNYTFEGKTQVLVAKMELDEANNTIFYTAIGGDVLDLYNKYEVIYKFAPKLVGGSVFLLTVKVEKRNSGDDPPTTLANYLEDLVTTVDAALCRKYYC